MVWRLQTGCRKPESSVSKPTLTVRSDWLVFGEGWQWRAKTAENTGNRRRPFRPVCWLSLVAAPANPPQRDRNHPRKSPAGDRPRFDRAINTIWRSRRHAADRGACAVPRMWGIARNERAGLECDPFHAHRHLEVLWLGSSATYSADGHPRSWRASRCSSGAETESCLSSDPNVRVGTFARLPSAVGRCNSAEPARRSNGRRASCAPTG